VTIDSWESAGCFASFLERFGEDYRRLDEALAGCRVSEKKLGEFVEG
jgi:hypothetical protein